MSKSVDLPLDEDIDGDPEQTYHLLFQQHPHPMYLYSPDSLRFLEVNDALVAQYGYSREELKGMLVTDFCLDQDVLWVTEAIRSLKPGDHRRVQNVHRRKDGSLISVEITSHWIRYRGMPARAVVALDVTERVRTEELLREGEDRFELVFEHAPMGMAIVALDQRWVRVNRALCDLVGYGPEELVGHGVREITHPEDVDLQSEKVEQLLDGVIDSYQMDKRYLRKDGGDVWVQITASLLRNPAGEPLHFIVQVQDITDRRRTEEELARHAEELRTRTVTDELTGLANRRGFQILAESQLEMAVRLGQWVAILYMDMDGLKEINDLLGHAEGDRAIGDAATVLRRTFRGTDAVARLGGDEFAVVATVRDPAEADLFLGRLRQRVDEHNAVQAPERGYPLSLSLGMALADPRDPTSLENLMFVADSRMYEQKHDRHGRVQ